MKSKAQSQLWISGLFPSAYWCGQALVDVPMYCLIFLLMYLMDYGLNAQDTLFTVVNQIIQILCAVGYAASLIFLTYVISFIFRKGKRNSGIWSFCFSMLNSFQVFIFYFQNEESGSIELFLVFLIPFLHFIIFLFILRCLEWKFGKKPMRKDPFFR
ncbi:ATP-binding cassette sub-family A member 8-like isoform X2 [Mirounga leonina]|nr:ATP-binding cassette sub-family A member 8-like isoform X2 [Mirounga leonina]